MKPKTVIEMPKNKLPRLPVTIPEASPNYPEMRRHFNAVMDALEYFRDNGVALKVGVKKKKGILDYSIQFTDVKYLR